VRRREWVDPVEAIERTEENGLRDIIESVCLRGAVHAA
jgi:hypothetical protein